MRELTEEQKDLIHKSIKLVPPDKLREIIAEAMTAKTSTIEGVLLAYSYMQQKILSEIQNELKKLERKIMKARR